MKEALDQTYSRRSPIGARSLRLLSRSRFALRLENGRTALKCTPPDRHHFTVVPALSAGHYGIARGRRRGDIFGGVRHNPVVAGAARRHELLALDAAVSSTGATWRAASPSDTNRTRQHEVKSSGQQRMQESGQQQQKQHRTASETIRKHPGAGVSGRKHLGSKRLAPAGARLHPAAGNHLLSQHIVPRDTRPASKAVALHEVVHGEGVVLQQVDCASSLMQQRRNGGRRKTETEKRSAGALREVTFHRILPGFLFQSPSRLHFSDGRNSDACSESKSPRNPSSPLAMQGIEAEGCREKSGQTTPRQEDTSACSSSSSRCPPMMQAVQNLPFVWAAPGVKRGNLPCPGLDTRVADWLESEQQVDEDPESPSVVEPGEEQSDTSPASKEVESSACMEVTRKLETWGEDVGDTSAASQELDSPCCAEVRDMSEASNEDVVARVLGGDANALQSVRVPASAEGCEMAPDTGEDSAPTSRNCDGVSQPQDLCFLFSSTPSRRKETVEGAERVPAAASTPAKGGEQHFLRLPTDGNCKQRCVSGRTQRTSKESLRCYLQQLTKALSNLLQHVANEDLQHKGDAFSCLPGSRGGSTPTTRQRVVSFSPTRSLREDKEEQVTRPTVSLSREAPPAATGPGGPPFAARFASPPLAQETDGRPCSYSVSSSAPRICEQRGVRLQGSEPPSSRAAAAAVVPGATARRRRGTAGGNRDALVRVQLPLFVSRNNSSSSDPVGSALETPGGSSLFRRTASAYARVSSPAGMASPSGAGTTTAAARILEPSRMGLTFTAPAVRAGRTAVGGLGGDSFFSAPAVNFFEALQTNGLFTSRTPATATLQKANCNCLSSGVREKENCAASDQRTCQNQQHHQDEDGTGTAASVTGEILAAATRGTEQQQGGTGAANARHSSSSVKEYSGTAKTAAGGRSGTKARSCSVRWRTDNEEDSGRATAEQLLVEHRASESCGKQGSRTPRSHLDGDTDGGDSARLASPQTVNQQLRTSRRKTQSCSLRTAGSSLLVHSNRRRRAGKEAPEASFLGGSRRAERMDIKKFEDVLEELQQLVGSTWSEERQTATNNVFLAPSSPSSSGGGAALTARLSPRTHLSLPPESCVQLPAAATAGQDSAPLLRHSSEADAAPANDGLTGLRAPESSAAEGSARPGGRAEPRVLPQGRRRSHLPDTSATPVAAAPESEAKCCPCLPHAALTPSPATPKPKQPQETDFSLGGSAGAALPAPSCPAAVLLRRRSSSSITCLGAHQSPGAAAKAAARTPAPSSATTRTTVAAAAAAGDEAVEPPTERGGTTAAGGASAAPPSRIAAAAAAIPAMPPEAGRTTATAVSPGDQRAAATAGSTTAGTAQQHRGLTFGGGGGGGQQQHALSATKPRGPTATGGQQQHTTRQALEEKCPLSPLPSPRSSLNDGCKRACAPALQRHQQQPKALASHRLAGENGDETAGEAARLTTTAVGRAEVVRDVPAAAPAAATGEKTVAGAAAEVGPSRGRGAAGGRVAGATERQAPVGNAGASGETTPARRTAPLAAAGSQTSPCREGRAVGGGGDDWSELEGREAVSTARKAGTAATARSTGTWGDAETAAGATHLRNKSGALPFHKGGERNPPPARLEDVEGEVQQQLVAQRRVQLPQQRVNQQRRRKSRDVRRHSSSKRSSRSSTRSSRNGSTDSDKPKRSCRKRSAAAVVALHTAEEEQNSTHRNNSISQGNPQVAAAMVAVHYSPTCPAGGNRTRSYVRSSRDSRKSQCAEDPRWAADAESEDKATGRGRSRHRRSYSSSDEEDWGSRTRARSNSRRRSSGRPANECGTCRRRRAERRSSWVGESSSPEDQQGARSSWIGPFTAAHEGSPSRRDIKRDSDPLAVRKPQKEQQEHWRQQLRKDSVSTSAGLYSSRSATSMQLLSFRGDRAAGETRQLQVSIGRLKNVYIHREERVPRRAFCVAYTQNDDMDFLIHRRRQRTCTARVEQDGEHVFSCSFHEKVLLPYDPLQAGVRVAVLQLLLDEDLLDAAPALEDFHYQLLGVTPLLLGSCFSNDGDGEEPAEDAGGKEGQEEDASLFAEEKHCWSLLCPEDPAASTGELEVRVRLLPARPRESC